MLKEVQFKGGIKNIYGQSQFLVMENLNYFYNSYHEHSLCIEAVK